MPSKNLAIIIGNVGKSMETRYTGEGTPVTSFSVATNERWKDKESGEWKSLTDWHDIVAWGRTSEIAQEKIKSGDLVEVSGKIRKRSWEHQGVKHYRTEIIAHEVLPLGRVSKDVTPASEENVPQDGQDRYEGEFEEADLERQDA